jgi:polysaccharide export outer membrane protein
VRPDGAISLPLINDVQAAGLTPMQLRQLIAQLLTVYVPNPEVSVIVREVHSAKVSVLGQVTHPGRYDLRGPVTLLEMLAHAGGLTPFATRSQIVVVRPRGDRIERILVDEERALSDRHHENVLLQSGDLIFVP